MLLLPAVGRVPWKLGELDQHDPALDQDGWVRKLFDVYAPFTAMFNITGQPGVSLPLAWTDDGLPIGVQVLAPLQGEVDMYRAARALEEVAP